MQTCQNFEWIVIDDGSTDNTKDLVEGWLAEGKIDIKYLCQANSGKMMAHNLAIKESQGELFMCIDSDDRLCSERVVEDALNYWDSEIKNLKDSSCICGFLGYKEIGAKKQHFPVCLHIVHLSELNEAGFKGELTMVFRRDVLEKYPFPYFSGEKFVTDVYVYDQIDREYKVLLFPYYMQHCEYQIGGYSSNYMKILFDNPQGYRAYHNQCVKFRKRGYVKSVICYIALSIRLGDRYMLRDAADRFLTIALFPLGILKFFVDNYRLSHTGR